MKKIVMVTMLFSAVSVSGVLWENDPSHTPEERQRAREYNERMRQKNSERKAEGEKQIEALSQKYKDVVENAKKRLKGNAEFQKEFAIAAGKFGMALATVAANAEQGLESNREYTKEIEQLGFDYLVPVIAKYDTEVKTYLDEVKAIKAKNRPIVG